VGVGCRRRHASAIRLESRAAINAWATQRLHARRGRFTSRHYLSGTLFEALTADSARTRTMVLVTHQDFTEAAPRPVASGVYHDQWRKTPEGWRLVRRRLHHDTREPLISAQLRTQTSDSHHSCRNQRGARQASAR
jgi:hypothetical protein